MDLRTARASPREVLKSTPALLERPQREDRLCYRAIFPAFLPIYILCDSLESLIIVSILAELWGDLCLLVYENENYVINTLIIYTLTLSFTL